MIARIALVLALFGLVASCARAIPQIVTPHPALPTFAPAQPTTIVVTPLTSAERVMRGADDLPRRLGALFAASGASILEERQLASVPAPRSFLVRIALVEARSDADGHRGVRGVLELEVTVFDVGGAPLARVATEIGIVPMIDVTGRTAILRRTYEVTTDTENAWAVTSDEEPAWDEQLRSLIAELLYAQLAPDLQAAIDRSEGAPMEIVPPSSGGERTMVVQ